jgi:ELWxxDGT repeat protein
LGQDIVMTRVGDRAVFQSENAQQGPQLWGSDGTAQGTVPLISTPTPSGSGYSQPLLGVVGTHGYYAVYNGTEYQAVVTDGTAAGTHVLTDAGQIDGNGINVTQVAGDDSLSFIYTYHRDTAGIYKHLYGYSPQSNTVTHLLDAPLFSDTPPIIARMGRLYFRGSDLVHADNPWVSDGTVGGTHILVNLSNVVPIAGNDSASSKNDAPVTIDVLANDSESGGRIDTTSVEIVSMPSHGSAMTAASGSIVYIPVGGFAGSDSLTYQVKDLQGALSNVATVTIAVTALAPTAGNVSASSKNDAAITINVLADDSEVGGALDAGSVKVVAKPSHGSVSVTASGAAVYTPNAGFAGSDSFTYTVKDTHGVPSNVATVAITVTAPPPTSGGGGGGGSTTLFELLALGGLVFVRRLSCERNEFPSSGCT